MPSAVKGSTNAVTIGSPVVSVGGFEGWQRSGRLSLAGALRALGAWNANTRRRWCAAMLGGRAGPVGSGARPPPAKQRRFRRPARADERKSSPESQISDRLACKTAQSSARKSRSGRFTAGGWGTTRSPKMRPRLGRSPGALGSRDIAMAIAARRVGREAPLTPTRRARPGDRELWVGPPWPETVSAHRRPRVACPEVGRSQRPTSWPSSAAGGGCQVAPAALHNTAPPRDPRQPLDAT